MFPEKKKIPFDKPMRIKMDPLEEENQPTVRKPNSHFSNMTLTECRNMQRCRSKMFMFLQAYNGIKIKIQFLNTAVTNLYTSYNIPRALTYLLTYLLHGAESFLRS